MSRGKKTLVIILCIFLILVICTAGVGLWAYSYYNNSIYKPVGEDVENVEVEIKSGSSTTRIAEQLYDKGLIKNVTTFRIYVKLKGLGNKLQAGKYEFNKGMTAEEIVEKIVNGDIKKDTVWLTIPEGYRVKDIAEAVEQAGLASKDEFLDAAESGKFEYDFLENLPEREVRLEGYLFPDTYEFPKDVTPEQIINKMLARFEDVIDEGIMSKAKEKGMTLDEVVIVASMIEKEAKVQEERPIIAGVIYNRLKKNMYLEFCSTVQYALGEWKESLTNDDTKIDSPYNTYQNPGLPIGPIASPGRASLEAAVNPVDTDYLFFVVKKNGGGTHVFTKTFSEHQKAIKENK